MKIAAQPHAANRAKSQTCGGMLGKRPTGRPVTLSGELKLDAVVVTVTVADAGLDPFSATEHHVLLLDLAFKQSVDSIRFSQVR
jgi:hypothetical protein